MNTEIKSKIEEYVKGGFNDLNSLDPTEDGYYIARGSIIKDISTLVDLLQKEDINENNKKFNNDKIINENTKIVKDHEINLKKIESENNNKKYDRDLDEKKINKSYEIDSKKIENDIAKLDNELRKINYENELNNKKLECDIDKVKNEVTKINQDYEINKDRNQIEKDKNKDYLHMENRKINVDEVKNNSDSELKKEELNLKRGIDIELRNDRIIKVIVDGVITIVPIVFYNLWMDRGFEFEKTGTFTSNTFKNMFSRFKLGK